MNKDPFDRIIQAMNVGQVLITIAMMVFVVHRAVSDGYGSTASWLAGIAIALLTGFFSIAINKGFQWLEGCPSGLKENSSFIQRFDDG